MYYGYIARPTRVYMKGYADIWEHVTWVKQHNSSGMYSYQKYGIVIDNERYVKWLFSNPEDAVLFALKFK